MACNDLVLGYCSYVCCASRTDYRMYLYGNVHEIDI